MKIFIMRHGKAEQTIPTSATEDAARALIKRGRDDATNMGQILNKKNISHVWVSPYVRAQQTCQQVLAELHQQPQVSINEDITPYGSAQQVQDYLDAVLATEKITGLLVVSHLPLVSYLVESLTFDRQAPVFQTAAIAEIDYDIERMKGQLVQMYVAKDYR